MANNRLWAVCKLDNEATVVMKYYPGGWYHVGVENEFFGEHDHQGNKHADCMGGEHIVFVYENSDPRVKFYDFRRLEEDDHKCKIYLKGSILPERVLKYFDGLQKGLEQHL